jgi:CLIP-associating protein 1/2
MQRMPRQRVFEHLDVVLPGVVVALGNTSSEVRKAAVFCLVDVYMILGEQVMPYLAKDLTPSQMKLVTIYIGRQQQEREEKLGTTKQG